ncbi:MAG: 7TM-DISM domain-containing protein [Bacteroidetes bacterium]|nr:7TM-DISM domain-containing protein [Bacteroidota bacterium]
MTITRLALLFFFVLYAQASVSQTSNTNEIIDARNWTSETTLALNGTCVFFENQLLSPSECKSQLGSLVDFPKLFDTDKETEFATFKLTVLLPTGEKDLALALPQMYCSYRLWANEKIIAENGTVGTTKAEAIPQWLPKTVPFHAESDTLTLVLQVSNFYHAKGGLKESIFLGKAETMMHKRNISVMSNIVEAAALFLIGIFYLAVFIFRTKKVTVYFALLCITWAVRALFSNLYLSISFLPGFDWFIMIRIEYVTLYLTMIWAVLFVGSIFQSESNVIIKYSLVFGNIIFAAFTLYSEPRLFTRGLNIYLIVSAILLLYCGYTVIRAWVNERTGSGLLTISLILALNVFGYDIFVYEGFSTYDPVIFSAGYIFIFLLMALALALHLQIIKSKPGPTSHLTYDDLYKNQNLN